MPPIRPQQPEAVVTHPRMYPNTTWTRTPAQSKQAILAQQEGVFNDALSKGTITQAEYDQAMAEHRRIEADPTAQASQSQYTQDYLASKAYYEKVGYPQYGGAFSIPSLPANTAITKIEKENGSLKFTLQKIESPALAQAKAQTEIREYQALRSNAQQGTRSGVTGVLPLAPVTQGLNSEDLQAYNEWKSARDRGRIIDATLFVVSGALIPVIGIGVAVKAATIGVGIAQGVKTGMTAYEGGDLSTSLLTPKEAIQAAEFGVIFGGADKLTNVALAKYGGQVGAKVAGSAPAVTTVEKIGVGGAKFGIETMQGTAIISGIQAAEQGKLSPEDVVTNLGFSAGFAAVGGAARFAGSRIPHPTIESITSRLTPKRARESAMFDRTVLAANSERTVGSQGWINELKVKTSTNPTERTIYDRAVIKANEAPPRPSPIGNNFVTKSKGKGDLTDLYNRVVANMNKQPIKTTKNGKGGSITSASNIEITTRTSPQSWVSQTLIVKPKTRTRGSMKPFGAINTVKMFEVSNLPIRDFTKAGIAKLKPKVETPLSDTGLVVVDKIGVEAVKTAKTKAKEKQPATIEWQGIGQPMANPFATYKGRSFYGSKGKAEDEVTYPATMPPNTTGSTSHLTITRLELNPLQNLGLAEIQRTKFRDIQNFDIGNALRFDLAQAQLYNQVAAQTTRQEQKQIQDTLQEYGLKTTSRTKLGFNFGGFEIFGLSRGAIYRKGGHKQNETIYPIITGADFLESFLSKTHKSSKRRGK